MIIKIFFKLFFTEKHKVVIFHFQLRSLIEKFRRECNGSKASGILSVLISRRTAVGGIADIGMLQNVILEILNGTLTPDKQKRIPVIQHAHLIRGHQFTPGNLIVC